MKEILPDEKTSIDIRDFENPEKLAIYLHALNQNDTEYDSNIDKILEIIKKQWFLLYFSPPRLSQI